MVENHPFYVKDTSHMISLIEGLGRIPEDALLSTFDVESLYTNIPHTGGLQVLQNFLQQRDSILAPSILLNWYYPITTLSLSQTFSFKFGV